MQPNGAFLAVIILHSCVTPSASMAGGIIAAGKHPGATSDQPIDPMSILSDMPESATMAPEIIQARA